MFKTIVKSSFRVSPKLYNSRFYNLRFASSQSDVDKKFQDIIDAIKNNPGLQQSVNDLKEAFEAKGITPGTKPSMVQMSMLLMDKKVSSSLKNFYNELQSANVNFSPEDLKSLLEMYNSQK